MKAIKTLTLAAAVLFGTAAQASLPDAIMYDGYCDGLSDIHATAPSVVEGMWDLSACGMTSYPFVGLHGRVGGINGVTGHYHPDSGAGYLLVRVNDDNTWFYLDTDGTVFNSGTWTDVSEGGVRGTQPSTMR